MDLQDLKQTWKAFGEQLSQSEIYNRRMLREMIEQKTRSTFEKLQRGAVFNLIVAVVFAAIILPLVHAKGGYQSQLSFWLTEALCGLCILMGGNRMRLLARFNVVAPPACLLKNVGDYKRWYIYEIVVGMPLVIIAVCLVLYIETGFSPVALFFAGLGFLTGLAFGYYGWLKHKGTMSEIERNMAELKELD